MTIKNRLQKLEQRAAHPDDTLSREEKIEKILQLVRERPKLEEEVRQFIAASQRGAQ